MVTGQNQHCAIRIKLACSCIPKRWAIGPHNVDRTITVRVCNKSIYLFHPAGHYDLVGSTVKIPKNICNDSTKSDAHKVKHEKCLTTIY